MVPLGPEMVRCLGVRVRVTSAGNLMGSRPMCDWARHVDEKERARLARRERGRAASIVDGKRNGPLRDGAALTFVCIKPLHQTTRQIVSAWALHSRPSSWSLSDSPLPRDASCSFLLLPQKTRRSQPSALTLLSASSFSSSPSQRPLRIYANAEKDAQATQLSSTFSPSFARMMGS